MPFRVTECIPAYYFESSSIAAQLTLILNDAAAHAREIHVQRMHARVLFGGGKCGRGVKLRVACALSLVGLRLQQGAHRCIGILVDVHTDDAARADATQIDMCKQRAAAVQLFDRHRKGAGGKGEAVAVGGDIHMTCTRRTAQKVVEAVLRRPRTQHTLARLKQPLAAYGQIGRLDR